MREGVRTNPPLALSATTLWGMHQPIPNFLTFPNLIPTFIQADGAIGEPSDESDFSLLAWDSFSQEIRDLFTVVRSITYILLSKLFEFT